VLHGAVGNSRSFHNNPLQRPAIFTDGGGGGVRALSCPEHPALHVAPRYTVKRSTNIRGLSGIRVCKLLKPSRHCSSVATNSTSEWLAPSSPTHNLQNHVLTTTKQLLEKYHYLFPLSIMSALFMCWDLHFTAEALPQILEFVLLLLLLLLLLLYYCHER
jgi:hypothetical protein